MNKLKILVSDTAPLYPPLWGGPKRIWGLYGNLGEEFEVTYVGIDCGLDKRYIDRWLKPNFREIIQPITKIYYPFRVFELRIIKNLTFDIFTYLFMWLDTGFKKILNSQKADILIASHPWSSPCFRIRKGQIFIYDAHNCEYILMKKILKNRWYKWFVLIGVYLIEYRACKKSRIIIASSQTDKDFFIKLYKVQKDKIYVIPNGTYIFENPDKEKKQLVKNRLGLSKKTVLFIGAYYNPNIEAAKEIVENIAPKLKDCDFVIVGNVCDYFRNNNLPKNVRLVGRVDEATLYDYLLASDIGINPMKSGSGINIKMLDYFSFGLPVVSTEVGARGIEGLKGRDFLISNIENFSMHIEDLFFDREYFERLSINAKRLAEEIYDWKKISKRFEAILSDLIGLTPLNKKSFSFCWRKID